MRNSLRVINGRNNDPVNNDSVRGVLDDGAGNEIDRADCRSSENIRTSVVWTKKSITPKSPKSVTRNSWNRQLKNFARWNPTTSRTAKDRRKSRLRKFMAEISTSWLLRKAWKLDIVALISVTGRFPRRTRYQLQPRRTVPTFPWK